MPFLFFFCVALCHDCDHPGLTNAFLARTAHPMARTPPSYPLFTPPSLPQLFLTLIPPFAQVASLGPASTLERHHAATAASLLSAPAASGVLSGLSPAARARVLTLLPALIAATDIERNGAYIAAYVASRGGVENMNENENGEDADVADARREALMAVLLKVADISNTAKAWPLARRWAELLKAEHLLLGTCRTTESGKIPGGGVCRNVRKCVPSD
jgi:hypothetical protein